MRGNGKRSKARAGVTLVEVMLAGALTTFAILVILNSFIFSAKIAHENAKTLLADNVAFDLLWRKFYTDYEQLKITTGTTPPLKKTYSDDQSNNSSPNERSPYVKQGTDPLALDPEEYPKYVYREYVDASAGGKILKIELYDGAEYERSNSLILLKEFTLFRSDIPRTSN